MKPPKTPKQNEYVPDLTERFPSDREELELCQCGCGQRPENCNVDRYEYGL